MENPSVVTLSSLSFTRVIRPNEDILYIEIEAKFFGGELVDDIIRELSIRVMHVGRCCRVKSLVVNVMDVCICVCARAT